MNVKLTKLGALANRYGAMTPPQFWQMTFKRANQVADEDGDVDLFWSELIDGLTEMRDRFYELNNEARYD